MPLKLLKNVNVKRGLLGSLISASILVLMSLLAHVYILWQKQFVWTVLGLKLAQPWAIVTIVSLVVVTGFVAGVLTLRLARRFISRMFGLFAIAAGATVQVTPVLYSSTSALMLVFIVLLPTFLGLMAALVTNGLAASMPSQGKS